MKTLDYWLIQQASIPQAIDIATTLSDEGAEEEWMSVADEFAGILLFGLAVKKDRDYWVRQARDVEARTLHIRDGLVDGTRTPDWHSELLWLMGRTAEAVDKIVDNWEG